MGREERLIDSACGNPECSVSTGIHDCLTFGSGQLNINGFWEHPCAICARNHEHKYPDDGPCWPHNAEDLAYLEGETDAQ